MANTDHFIKASTNGQAPVVATLTNIHTQGSEAFECDNLTGWADTAAFVVYETDSNGNLIPGSETSWVAEKNNKILQNAVLTSGTDRDYPANKTMVVADYTAEAHNRLVTALLKTHNQDGTLKTGVVDGKALKAGSVSNGHMVDGAIDSKKIKWEGINGDRLADNSVDSRVLNSASFAKIQYVETPNTDLTTQYAHVYTPKITIPKTGKYLIIASYQTQGWKNGLSCDFNIKIVKDSAATNPQDVNIDYANFKSAGFHGGAIQKVATLSSNDKVRARVEIGQAVPVQISVKLSVIPVGMF